MCFSDQGEVRAAADVGSRVWGAEVRNGVAFQGWGCWKGWTMLLQSPPLVSKSVLTISEWLSHSMINICPFAFQVLYIVALGRM